MTNDGFNRNLRRQQDAALARLANPPFLALLFFLFFARLNLGPSGAQDRVGLLQETTALPFGKLLSSPLSWYLDDLIAVFDDSWDVGVSFYFPDRARLVLLRIQDQWSHFCDSILASLYCSRGKLIRLLWHNKITHSVTLFRRQILVSIISSCLFSLVMVYGIGLQSSPVIFVEFWFTSFALLSAGESIGVRSFILLLKLSDSCVPKS